MAVLNAVLTTADVPCALDSTSHNVKLRLEYLL